MSGGFTPTTPPPTFASKAAEWGAVAVSIIVLLIFVVALGIALLTKDPSLQILLGMAGANAGTAVGYWLGSSAGSQKKTDIMAPKP